MNTDAVRLEVSQDCSLISAETVTKRLMEVSVTAPDAVRSIDRLPLNLALIIDRSGSMSGQKLEFVKQAACHVLKCLTERDQVAIIAFDHEVEIIFATTPVTAQQQAILTARICALQTRGSTNLFDGWLYGVNEVATHLMPHGINRALLLTDGCANHGETNREILEHHAREMRIRGVSTSTFGVAPDYNEFLLEGIATHGGGNYHFIEHPSSIPLLFQQELGELQSIVARQTTLKFTIPAGTALNLLGDLPHETLGRTVTIPLGDLFAGSKRVLCAEVLTPTGKTGTLTFNADLSYMDQSQTVQTERAAVTFTYASERAAKSAPRDWPVRRRAAELRVVTAETRALRMAEEGKYQEAAESLLKVVTHYAKLLAPERVAELQALAQTIRNRQLSNMERKVRHDSAYRMRHSR